MISKKEIRNKVQNYLFEYIGNKIIADDPKINEKSRIWEVPVLCESKYVGTFILNMDGSFIRVPLESGMLKELELNLNAKKRSVGNLDFEPLNIKSLEIDDIMELVESKDLVCRYEAIEELIDMAKFEPRALYIEILTKFTKDEELVIRLKTIELLFYLDIANNEVKELIFELAKDDDLAIRNRILDSALRSIKLNSSNLCKDVLEILKEKEDTISENVMEFILNEYFNEIEIEQEEIINKNIYIRNIIKDIYPSLSIDILPFKQIPETKEIPSLIKKIREVEPELNNIKMLVKTISEKVGEINAKAISEELEKIDRSVSEVENTVIECAEVVRTKFIK